MLLSYIFLYLLLFAVSCFFLIKAGSWTVQSLTRIAQFLQWKEFVVAFIIMAFATTIPEFFVGITSALKGVPELSFGNVIGSNVINLSLAIAWIVFLLKGSLKIEDTLIRKNLLYVLLINLLPFILILDKNLSRIDGVILLSVLIIYLYHLVLREKKFTRPMINSVTFKAFLKDLMIFLVSIIILLLAAQGVTASAVSLAKMNNLSLILIGTLLIAFGTNLPELTFGARAVALGRPHMALGDLMGAVIINSTWVLGTTAIIRPFQIENLAPYSIGIGFIIASIILFIIFAKTHNEITKKEAAVLAFLYLLFVILIIRAT